MNLKRALALITSQEQRIKELTEDVAVKVVALIELDKQITRLTAENERLRSELEQRPPKLIITKLPKKGE